MYRELLLGLILVAAPLAGCLDAGDDLEPSSVDATANGSTNASGEAEAPTNDSSESEEPPDPTEGTNGTDTSDEGPDWDPRSNVTLTDDGRVDVEVPVHVALVGLPSSTAEGLADALSPVTVDHGLNGRANPLRPTANYQVHRLPGVAEELSVRLEAWTVSSSQANGTIYDADRVESFLSDRLPEEGVPVGQAPVVVFLHDGSTGENAYRYGYPSGYLEPVRAFGGSSSLLALDVSARQDPWVNTTSRRSICPTELPVEQCSGAPRIFDRPLEASGEQTVASLAEATRAATHFRLLQGPLYPPTTRPCYAVTAIIGVESTALNQHAPSSPSFEALFDQARLASVLEQVTGPATVHFDVTILELPQDDPVLHAVAESNVPTGPRVWLEENWSDYWVTHEGCEPVVSFHLFGDASQQPVGDWGIAFHDPEDGYRVSLSWTAGLERFQRTYHGEGSDQLEGENASSPGYKLVDHLIGHETGHLLGLRHPHDVTPNRASSDQPNTWTFSSTRTSMSYQVGDRIAGFGELDRDNLLRNRAGELVRTARDQGLEDEVAFEQALVELGDRDWAEANRKLDALLANAS